MPLNDGYTNDELLYYLRDSESKLLITDKETSSELKSKKLDQGFIIETIEKDSLDLFQKLIKNISLKNLFQEILMILLQYFILQVQQVDQRCYDITRKFII